MTSQAETRKSPDSLDCENAIFIRPQPWSAQYYRGEKNFIDSLLLELKDNFKICLLPRGAEQVSYSRQMFFCVIKIPEKCFGLSDIMQSCSLFIGAGGTMTREAAVLGVPTISIYQDDLLDVDRFLLDKGAMVYNKNLTAVYVLDFIANVTKKPVDKELMLKGREAYSLIMNTLLRVVPNPDGRT